MSNRYNLDSIIPANNSNTDSASANRFMQTIFLPAFILRHFSPGICSLLTISLFCHKSLTDQLSFEQYHLQ